MEDKWRVLEAISRLTKAQGYPPTYRELASELDLSVSVVHRLVRSLIDDGRVSSHEGLARSLLVNEPLPSYY